MIGRKQRQKKNNKKTTPTWREPVEGVRSKDLKSDLEIMLTQRSRCVRSRGTVPGSRAALGGAIDRQRRLGVSRPWSKPRQCSGAGRGKENDHFCLPDLFVPSPHRTFHVNMGRSIALAGVAGRLTVGGV